MKVGFIGCGGFASGNHIPNVHKNPAQTDEIKGANAQILAEKAIESWNKKQAINL